MEKIWFDDYGRGLGEPMFGYPRRPYLKETAPGGNIYECYTDDDLGKIGIYRKTTDNNIDKWEVGIGKWADRATIEYHPVGTPFDYTAS